MGTSKFVGKNGGMCGQIWVPYDDSRWRMSEPRVVKGFEQPFRIKNQNTQLDKQKSDTGKTHDGQKKCSIRVAIMISKFLFKASKMAHPRFYPMPNGDPYDAMG